MVAQGEPRCDRRKVRFTLRNSRSVRQTTGTPFAYTVCSHSFCIFTQFTQSSSRKEHAEKGNTTERATAPASAPVAGAFDFDSAQIHDVLQETGDDQKPRYVAVLVDAQGRSLRAELEPEEGRQLYKTMSIIKKHPLLEAVYRDVVMGFLDKLADADSLRNFRSSSPPQSGT